MARVERSDGRGEEGGRYRLRQVADGKMSQAEGSGGWGMKELMMRSLVEGWKNEERLNEWSRGTCRREW